MQLVGQPLGRLVGERVEAAVGAQLARPGRRSRRPSRPGRGRSRSTTGWPCRRSARCRRHPTAGRRRRGRCGRTTRAWAWRRGGGRREALGSSTVERHDRSTYPARLHTLDAVAPAYTRPRWPPSTPRPLVVPVPWPRGCGEWCDFVRATRPPSCRLPPPSRCCARSRCRSVGGTRSTVATLRSTTRPARPSSSSACRTCACSIVQADSIASNAYLLAGQESREQREQYDDRIATATGRLVEVSNAAAGGDVATLEQGSTLLATYVGLVEQARANNRQGFPVGAAYQRQARDVAEQLVDSLRTVEQSSRRRVNDSMQRAERAGWLLVLTAVLLLAVLVAGSLWLAFRWRRLINVPIAIAGLIAAVGPDRGRRHQPSSGQPRRRHRARVVDGSRPAGAGTRRRLRRSFERGADTGLPRQRRRSYETQWKLSVSVVEQAIDLSVRSVRPGVRGVRSVRRLPSGTRAGPVARRRRDGGTTRSRC